MRLELKPPSRRSRRLLVSVLVLVAASSAGVAALLLSGHGDERAAKTSVDAQRGVLIVDQGRGPCFFTEGALPYVKLESADGHVIVERLVRDTRCVLPLLRLQLQAGHYRLVSYQRPCEGSCPRRGGRGLDPPTPQCAATLDITPEQTLTALVRPLGGRGCRIGVGERIGPADARRTALVTCRDIADGREWPTECAAAYAVTAFRGFEAPIRQAAAEACAEGIRTMTHPIRLVLDGPLVVGKIAVEIANVGPRPYLFEAFYQACFLAYFDASGRRFIIPPGTHCDLRAKEPIRPGETKRLFTWRLDECVKDAWGCVRSRPLPPGKYTITGRFKPAAGAASVRAAATFEITAGY